MYSSIEWSIPELSKEIVKTQQIDKDFVIAISGGTGEGKSTLAIKLAKGVQPDFDIKSQMFFSRDKMIEAIDTIKPGSVLVADEAVAMVYRRDFAQRGQKDLMRLLDMCRYKRLFIIWCIPVFWNLDKHLLNRTRFWIQVLERGRSVVMRKSNNFFSHDAWYQKENEKRLLGKVNVYGEAPRLIGFTGFLRFGDLHDYEKAIYVPLSMENKRLKPEEVKQDQDSKDKIRLWTLIDKGLTEKKWSHQEIAEILDIKKESFTVMLSGWRKKIKDHREALSVPEPSSHIESSAESLLMPSGKSIPVSMPGASDKSDDLSDQS